MDGFWDLVGIKDGPLSKNLAVKIRFEFDLEIQICNSILAQFLTCPIWWVEWYFYTVTHSLKDKCPPLEEKNKIK